MAGEDQERFEDYLELERFIEDLQAGRVTHAPEGLTPDQARIYRMATLFHAASTDGTAPRPEFVAELQAKLGQIQTETAKGASTSRKAFPFFSKKPQAQPRVSRRSLLAGGAAAVAASLSVGVGITHAVEAPQIASLQATITSMQSWSAEEKYVAEGANTTWFPVTTLSNLGEQPVPFNSGGVVGYVIRNDGDSGDPSDGPIVAVSAACTHMGCLVQWQSSDKKFHCPCHGGIFTEYGKNDKKSAVPYLKPLPRLEVQVDPDGTIKVRVPNIPASSITSL
jgi:Rieske Fe-S protein